MVVDVRALGAQAGDDLQGGRLAGVGDAGLVGGADEQHACLGQGATELD